MTLACRQNNAHADALHCTSTFASLTTISAVLFACYFLTCRPMASDDESSWHSGMAILEQRSTSRSAGSSARTTEVPEADIPLQKTTKSKHKKKQKSNKTRKKTKKTSKSTKRKSQTIQRFCTFQPRPPHPALPPPHQRSRTPSIIDVYLGIDSRGTQIQSLR